MRRKYISLAKFTINNKTKYLSKIIVAQQCFFIPSKQDAPFIRLIDISFGSNFMLVDSLYLPTLIYSIPWLTQVVYLMHISFELVGKNKPNDVVTWQIAQTNGSSQFVTDVLPKEKVADV